MSGVCISRTWKHAARSSRSTPAKLGREDFERNRLVYDATLRNLELLGEAAQQVPEDIRAKAPEVPWRKIVAVRNILIHGYFGIDNDIIWDIVTSGNMGSESNYGACA